MPLPSRRSGAALAALATVGATLLAPTASFAAPTGVAGTLHTTTSSGGLQCDAGLSPTLAFETDESSSVELPFGLTSPAGAASKPGGYGTNPSAVGADITVNAPSLATTTFGLQRSGEQQGVPWNNAGGDLSQGSVDSWYLMLDEAGRVTVTITYDKPVFGMRTAITDLDNGDETMTLNAYANATGGTAIPLDVQSLSNPDTLPTLAPDRTHDGNAAYVVDETSVRSNGGNSFTSIRSQNNDDKTGAVYFAFDSDEPVQRVEMSYDATRGRGFFFAPPSVPQACVQPNLSTDTVSQGATATLTSTIANRAGSGRIHDIDFDYELPTGVRVADDPKITADDCAGTVTAEPGSSRVSVRGADAAAGASACDFSVDLVFDEPGSIPFTKTMIAGASNLVPASTKPVKMTVTPDAPALVAELSVAPLETLAAADRAPESGDKIAYTATITNTGNTPITAVEAIDSLETGIVCTGLPVAVGKTAECTSASPYEISQDDIDTGVLRNELAAHGVSATGKAASAPLTAVEQSLAAAPSLVTELTGSVQSDGTHVRAGDTVTYSSNVTNGGNVTVRDLQITDHLGTAMSCDATELAPGATVDCDSAGAYTLTQADVDAGVLENFSVASGASPDGRPVASHTRAFSVPLLAAASTTTALELVASTDVIAVGTEIRSVLTVRNTGNVTLGAGRITDTLGAAYVCADTVAPGADLRCESAMPYLVTQSDVDAGTLAAVASGHVVAPNGARVAVPAAEAQLKIVTQPAVAAEMIGSIVAADEALVRAGDIIRYTGVVTNTGDVTLTGLALVQGDLDCSVAALAPGENAECRTADHVLTQADVDAGKVVTRFELHALAPNGAAVTAPRSTVHTAIAAAPAVAVEVDAALDDDAVERPSAGDEVEYRATIRNLGNVTLSGASLLGGLGTLFICDDDIAPGASVTCVGDTPSALTQEQIDAGAIVNTVSGNALAPSGAVVELPATEARTSLRAVGEIEAEVATSVRNRDGQESPVTFGSAIVEPGDGLRYAATITNTGNVTVSDVTINDQPSSQAGCDVRTIAPGESVTCTSASPIVITESDIAAGQAEHTLVAEGLMPRASDAPETTRAAVADADDEGLKVHSKPITTVTGLTHLPGLVDGQLGHHLRGLVATGVGPAGAVGVAALALFAGLGGVLIAKRRAAAREDEATML
ncbi:hypothetical protein KXS11_09830 [Plantibacter flavus]|uniref:DUF7507 domain-containing protein n=1 Tax=Plantibacter flavus TaxID=150123 RepID=UPI003F134D45